MKRIPNLTPSTKNILMLMGENIRNARLRRRITAEQLAERADISRSTLWLIEKGSPAVAMGAYCQVLFALGLDKDLLNVAADDVLGKKLQELDLSPRKRAPKRITE